jgi:hypothetical protein
MEIQVSFSSDQVGDFTTTARFWANTRNCRDTSVWIARVTAPGPQITGYDWKDRWEILGGCTKNTATEYTSTVFAYNTGDAEFIVDKVELIGPDAVAGHFRLGTAQEIRQGDRIRQIVGTDTPKVFQTVIFIPGPAERIYTADIKLTATDGKTASATLRGVGIESHIQSQNLVDFGRHLFIPGTTQQLMQVPFTFNGTRDVTVTDIEVTTTDPASAGQFTIVNLPSYLKTYPKNETMVVDVLYQPTAPGDHFATLKVNGDFVVCDDSTTDVIGKAYTLNSRPHSATYGTVLTCFDSTSFIYLENDGSDPVVLQDIQQVNGPEFTIVRPTMPDTIAPGERLPVSVIFAPTANGTFNGTVTFIVTDLTGQTPVLFGGQPITATITGSGAKVTGHAHIAETYRGLPGKTHDIKVTMDDAIPQARIDQLQFSLRYKHGMMQPRIDQNNLNGLVAGTTIANWTVTAPSSGMVIVDPADPTVSVLYLDLTAPPGDFLKSAGDILSIPFVTFIGDTTASPLPFFLTPRTRLACADIVTDPGLAALDSVCGLNFRLISAFGPASYALRQNSPNPFNPTTDIQFSVGLDGQTTLMVYDAKGSQVATLVDTYLQPGEYTVTWDASNMPSGLYYYRIVSGHWSQTQSMMLQK